MPSFSDHFSEVAAEYARFRPRYPDEIFRYLAALAPGNGGAWDCATGSGQAAVPLASYFQAVVGTDASAEQIAQATPHERIVYRVASAEASGIPPGSMDLVTVAQALHWLDLPSFYAEVRRASRPGGILAVWSYALRVADEGIQRILDTFYRETVGAYWPPERRMVEDGYRSLSRCTPPPSS